MCNPKCSKVALIIINIIFILLGLGLLIPGILVIINDDGINEKVLPALQTVDFGVSNFGDLAKGLSITLIVMGSFVLVLSLLGGCGACCEAKLLLTIYSIVVVILFIGKLVIVILWIVFKADFECCGIDAVAGTGAANNDYTGSAWYTGAGADELPVSCCPSATSSSYTSTCSFTKGSAPSGQHSKGCYNALKDFADKYSIAFICVGVFILLVEVVAFPCHTQFQDNC
ncbi:TSPAN18 [Mytilus edulis]|uniref:TSPAN18 n=1 Tax=Mytilus edulis TaxID=6550 RepID=A0A8S3U1Q2_MYTED|nr:TSPAN18 [Mytilus edulis]